MSIAKSLPDNLLASHKNWKQTGFADQADHFATLGKGQSPEAMVISCADSRVQSTEIFDVAAGTFFLHRNIANLVPAYQSADGVGTAAALEYAVKALKVPHLIIMGHSQCGGVQACYDLCEGDVAAADSGFEFVGHWLDTLRPAYGKIDAAAPDPVVDMGQKGVLTSLDNLMGYPFVRDAVAAGALHLHGLWHDIASGTLHAYNSASGVFEVQ